MKTSWLEGSCFADVLDPQLGRTAANGQDRDRIDLTDSNWAFIISAKHLQRGIWWEIPNCTIASKKRRMLELFPCAAPSYWGVVLR